MSRKKYINDYKIEREIDSKGRERSTARYDAGYYRFVKEAGTVARKRKVVAAACVAAWAAFVAALIPASAVMHLPYYSIPFVFTAVPLFMLSDAGILLYREEPPLKRRTSDKFSKRFLSCSVALFVLAGGSAIGFIAGALTEWARFTAADAVPAASSLIMFASAAAVFSTRSAFETVATEAPAPPEADAPEEPGESD